MSKVGERDVRGFFSMFGEIESVDIEFDKISGENRGQAIVHFVRSSDAEAAIKKMNGFIISETPIVVTKLPYHLASRLNNDSLDERRDGYHPSHSRALLSSKLAGAAKDAELTQKEDKSEVEILEKTIKKDRHYSYDETRVLGLFNLIDPERIKEEGYVDDIVKDVKCRLIS